MSDTLLQSRTQWWKRVHVPHMQARVLQALAEAEAEARRLGVDEAAGGVSGAASDFATDAEGLGQASSDDGTYCEAADY